jgi:hypothetical protein
MSDGLSDGNAVNKLATDVENRTWDLVAAIYRARSGHHGLTPGDGIELANEKLRLFGLRSGRDLNQWMNRPSQIMTVTRLVSEAKERGVDTVSFSIAMIESLLNQITVPR